MNNVIEKKLQHFIKLYYKNLALKGFVYSLLLLVACFVFLSVIEYFGWQSTLARTIIFYSFIVLVVAILFFLVLIPLGKIFYIGKSFGKALSYKQAAKIIGNHFPEVQDKLLNLLQLQEQNNQDDSLLTSAIEQKTQALSPIPFSKAINTSHTKKISQYLVIVAVLLALLIFLFPKIFSEPAYRYINHNTYYEKPAPFSFVVRDENMQATQQSDYMVEVQTVGEMLPEQVYISVDGQSFEMKKKDKTHFSYTINQIPKTTSIKFKAADIESKEYLITVNPKPIITELKAKLIYPAYTKLKTDTILNITDLSIPKGTKIQWFIRTEDTEQIIFKTSSDSKIIEARNNLLKLAFNYLSSQSICIKAKNKFVTSSDSVAFAINVIEDERPQIAVIEEKDSNIADKIYFRGQIKDDYGFSKLEFHLKITPKESDKAVLHKDNLKVTAIDNAQEFYYFVDLNDYTIQAGDKIEYYFEVWDNDAINGAKSTRSQSFCIAIPTEKELDAKLEKNNEAIKDDANKALSELRKLQKQINELAKKLTEKKELSWQDKKELESLKEKQQKVQQQIEDIQKKMQENSALEEKYSDIDEELMQKQMELEKLFEQIQDKDLKELMQKLEELTKKNLDKDKVSEELKNIKNKNEELSKELDKNIELYKRLDVEKEINNAIDKLNELSKKQQELAKETKEGKQDKNSLNKKQEEINKEFNDLQKKMDEIKKKDSALEDPFNFKQDKEKENNIKNDLQQAKENINKNKNKSAAKNQENAAKQMQEMAEQIEKNQEESEEEQLAEDIDNIRQILKNLVTLSKEQEDLIYLSQQTSVSDPSYQNLVNKQNVIKESMKDISDSLYNISKRQPQVSKIIADETSKVREGIEKSLSTLLKFNQSFYSSYHNTQAANAQQSTMASMNNLSLLLAESLNNMNQQQQQQSKNKNGKPNNSCSNAGQGKPQKQSIKSMREMQEALNKEIERLQKELDKQGKQPKPKIGEGAKLNEALAKAAAQQEMIRKMMQEYLNQQKQDNAKSAGGDAKALKQMEQTEQDIVNKKISANTLKRQNEILTRMLQSERAKKKQDKDKERKSNTGIDKFQENPNSIEAFKKLKNRDLELFKKIPPVYSSYYKLKVNEYFYNFENSNKNKK